MTTSTLTLNGKTYDVDYVEDVLERRNTERTKLRAEVKRLQDILEATRVIAAEGLHSTEMLMSNPPQNAVAVAVLRVLAKL